MIDKDKDALAELIAEYAWDTDNFYCSSPTIHSHELPNATWEESTEETKQYVTSGIKDCRVIICNKGFRIFSFLYHDVVKLSDSANNAQTEVKINQADMDACPKPEMSITEKYIEPEIRRRLKEKQDLMIDIQSCRTDIHLIDTWSLDRDGRDEQLKASRAHLKELEYKLKDLEEAQTDDEDITDKDVWKKIDNGDPVIRYLKYKISEAETNQQTLKTQVIDPLIDRIEALESQMNNIYELTGNT